MKFIYYYQKLVRFISSLDGVSALLIRLFLAPVFIIAGYNKLGMSNVEATGINRFLADENIVAWFGNSEWGLGLPFPELLANLAAWTEFLGGWLLLIGLLTRLISIPLMFTMFIAATTVHLENGWYAIAPTNGDTSTAKVFEWLGFEQATQSINKSEGTYERLTAMKDILSSNGNTDWLYEHGSIVVLNNGVEFAVTYFILLLALLLIGAGRFTSIDYYLYRFWLKPNIDNSFH